MHLYNLKEDIQETTDVASEHYELVKRMEAIFEKEHEVPENDRFRIEALVIKKRKSKRNNVC